MRRNTIVKVALIDQRKHLWPVHGISVFIDSKEMLSQLPDTPFIRKIAGYYPHGVRLDALHGKIDAILAYSMLHYVFVESNLWNVLDQSLALLAPGGQMLMVTFPTYHSESDFLVAPLGLSFIKSLCRQKRHRRLSLIGSNTTKSMTP